MIVKWCQHDSAERGLALDVLLGKVDFVEVLQRNEIVTEVIYRFWNMGFRLTPTAGSDYPYAPIIGNDLFFAHVDGDFTFDKWIEGLRAGHTFVSDGPVLQFTVADELPGAELRLLAPEKVTVHARASVNPSLDNMERLELVRMGEVIESVTADTAGEGPLEIRSEIALEESTWIAARAYARNGRAHTAPVYVVVGSTPIANENIISEVAWAEAKLREIEALLDDEQSHPLLLGQAPRLRELISEARAVYTRIAGGDALP